MYKTDSIVRKVDYAKSWSDINRNALLTAITTFEYMDAIHHNMECHYVSFNLSRSQFLVLYELFFSSEQMLTPTELTALTHITRSGMTRCLNGLEKVSYIHRLRSSVDHRVLCIWITDMGRAYMEDKLPYYYTYFSQVFSHLDCQEQKMLIDILYKLKDSANCFRLNNRPGYLNDNSKKLIK
jgi:DNA-binding MarR family transcriptional regulator